VKDRQRTVYTGIEISNLYYKIPMGLYLNLNILSWWYQERTIAKRMPSEN